MALKRYLKYAQTGETDIPRPNGREADSPFEVEVADDLRGCGYEIDHQIGSAGYFIDLAVKDPERPGRYLLGIECDGATYHSAQSARDRDRIRQGVLEGLGWRIHRIWSTDWFRFPDRELKKAVEAIEAAKAYVPSTSDSLSDNKTHDSNEGTEEPETEVDPTPEPKPNSLAKKYRLAKLDISTNGSDLHAVPPDVMADWIQHIVKIESPVHVDEVAKRIANAVGVKKIGNRIRDTVKSAAGSAEHSKSIQVRDEFFYNTKQRQIRVRDRSKLPNTSRKLELIAPEEIQEAIKLIVSESYGIEQNDLAHETCRLFGFKRVTPEMKQRVKSAINEMIKRGDLIEKGESLVSS